MADNKLVPVDDNMTQVFKTLMFFTILMVTMPLTLYFTTKSFLFEGLLGMTSMNSYFYAALVAIVAVHVVLCMFIYVAWNDGKRTKAE